MTLFLSWSTLLHVTTQCVQYFVYIYCVYTYMDVAIEYIHHCSDLLIVYMCGYIILCMWPLIMMVPVLLLLLL